MFNVKRKSASFVGSNWLGVSKLDKLMDWRVGMLLDANCWALYGYESEEIIAIGGGWKDAKW